KSVKISSLLSSGTVTGITDIPDICQACMWLKPFMVSVWYLYPLPQAPPISLSGLRLTMPKGRLADEKKNHLEFAESRSGYTKSTGLGSSAGIFGKVSQHIIPKMSNAQKILVPIFFILIFQIFNFSTGWLIGPY